MKSHGQKEPSLLGLWSLVVLFETILSIPNRNGLKSNVLAKEVGTLIKYTIQGWEIIKNTVFSRALLTIS